TVQYRAAQGSTRLMYHLRGDLDEPVLVGGPRDEVPGVVLPQLGRQLEPHPRAVHNVTLALRVGIVDLFAQQPKEHMECTYSDIQ
ncbi:hypothetical protein EBR96_10700, partial [bacterium]|nr:hypothetical protein [bacterium]